jgi:hypothetical protein
MGSRVDGSQRRSGHGGEEKNIFPCHEPNPGRPDRTTVTKLSELSRPTLAYIPISISNQTHVSESFLRS